MDYQQYLDDKLHQLRDLFMLSFYLCGMNAVDLRKLPLPDESNKRIGYNRSKTSSRRRDKAYINMHIPAIAMPIYLKYAGTLQGRYADHTNLDHALSFGMKKIGAAVKIKDLEFYDAQHGFGDLARNKCRFSKDDVALALNHKDQLNRVTDIYLGKNWDIIDEVQAGVIKLMAAYDKKKNAAAIIDDIELPAVLLIRNDTSEAVLV